MNMWLKSTSTGIPLGECHQGICTLGLLTRSLFTMGFGASRQKLGIWSGKLKSNKITYKLTLKVLFFL